MLDPMENLEEVLGGLHEWRDVKSVVRTIFQALCDVAHAQSHAVREVEQRMADLQEDLTARIDRKADAHELRSTNSALIELRSSTELIAQRLDEEAQVAVENQGRIFEDMQALRTGLNELRAAFEKNRADIQQWHSGFEAGLSRVVAECTQDIETSQSTIKATVQMQLTNIVKDINLCSTREEVQAAVARLDKTLEGLESALQDKATIAQLKEIVREAWTREEGHIGRLHRLCESKVSTTDFAALAAVAEGKASLADVDSVVQRQVQRRLQALLTDQQLVNRAEVSSLTEACLTDAKGRLRECERRCEELTRRQQRAASSNNELRAEVKHLALSKLERAEAEALIAGALADWVRAAQRGADAVQAAVSRGRSSRENSASSMLDYLPQQLFSNDADAEHPHFYNTVDSVLQQEEALMSQATAQGMLHACHAPRWNHNSGRHGKNGSTATGQSNRPTTPCTSSQTTLHQLRKAHVSTQDRAGQRMRAASAERIHRR